MSVLQTLKNINLKGLKNAIKPRNIFITTLAICGVSAFGNTQAIASQFNPNTSNTENVVTQIDTTGYRNSKGELMDSGLVFRISCGNYVTEVSQEVLNTLKVSNKQITKEEYESIISEFVNGSRQVNQISFDEACTILTYESNLEAGSLSNNPEDIKQLFISSLARARLELGTGGMNQEEYNRYAQDLFDGLQTGNYDTLLTVISNRAMEQQTDYSQRYDNQNNTPSNTSINQDAQKIQSESGNEVFATFEKGTFADSVRITFPVKEEKSGDQLNPNLATQSEEERVKNSLFIFLDGIKKTKYNHLNFDMGLYYKSSESYVFQFKSLKIQNLAMQTYAKYFAGEIGLEELRTREKILRRIDQFLITSQTPVNPTRVTNLYNSLLKNPVALDSVGLQTFLIPKTVYQSIY